MKIVELSVRIIKNHIVMFCSAHYHFLQFFIFIPRMLLNAVSTIEGEQKPDSIF